MTWTTQFFGELSQLDAELTSIDNISVVQIIREVDNDITFYNDQSAKFFGPLTELISVPQKTVRYYDGEDLENWNEAARPSSRTSLWDYTQEIPFEEKMTALTLTTRAVKTMTADELAAYVQSKLTAFQKAKFNALRQAIFNNTNRVIIDSQAKYQTTSLPFWNSATGTSVPAINGYTFVSGDLQHYNGVATGTTPTGTDVRTRLIDKVRHHGFNQIEIWVSPYDYSLEALTGIFVPADNQIGRSLMTATGTATNERMRPFSPWENLVGFVYNCPIIKTPIVPPNYAIAVGTDGGALKAPFLSRQHPIASLQGLQTEVKSNFPLENTIMTEGFGYAPNHRGAVAVLQMNSTTYTVPTIV